MCAHKKKIWNTTRDKQTREQKSMMNKSPWMLAFSTESFNLFQCVYDCQRDPLFNDNTQKHMKKREKDMKKLHRPLHTHTWKSCNLPLSRSRERERERGSVVQIENNNQWLGPITGSSTASSSISLCSNIIPKGTAYSSTQHQHNIRLSYMYIWAVHPHIKNYKKTNLEKFK